MKNQHFPTRLVSVVTAISNRLRTIKNGRPKAANSTENETRTVGDGQPAPSEECLPGAADRFRLCTSASERGTVRVRPSGLWCAAARLCNSSPPSPETLYCRLRLSPEFRAPAARRAGGHSPLPHQSPRGPGLSARSVPAKDPEAQSLAQRVRRGASAARLDGWPQRYAAAAHAQTTNLMLWTAPPPARECHKRGCC